MQHDISALHPQLQGLEVADIGQIAFHAAVGFVAFLLEKQIGLVVVNADHMTDRPRQQLPAQLRADGSAGPGYQYRLAAEIFERHQLHLTLGKIRSVTMRSLFSMIRSSMAAITSSVM